jgi:hypothetical protein
MNKEEIIIRLKFFNKPAIIINEEGILINMIGKYLIKWIEIKDYSIIKTKNKSFMLLFVDNPEHFFDEANWLAKFKMKLNMHKYKTPLRISTFFLQYSFDELKNAILEGMKRAALARKKAKM